MVVTPVPLKDLNHYQNPPMCQIHQRNQSIQEYQKIKKHLKSYTNQNQKKKIDESDYSLNSLDLDMTLDSVTSIISQSEKTQSISSENELAESYLNSEESSSTESSESNSTSEDEKSSNSEDRTYIRNCATFMDHNKGKSNFLPDSSMHEQFKLLTIDIDDFVSLRSGDPFEKYGDIYFAKHGDDFMVGGKLYIKSLSKYEVSEKLMLDINITHPRLPPLYGFCSNEKGNIILEIRKINFEPIPLNYHNITDDDGKKQIFIAQFINFMNYIMKLNHSITLIDIEDLFRYCFLDPDGNLYFGDLSFIETENYHQKSLFSIGIIVNQLLDGEYKLRKDKTIQKLSIDCDISSFWKKFIKTSWIENVHVPSFYSKFMKFEDDEDFSGTDSYDETEEDNLEENELDIDYSFKEIQIKKHKKRIITRSDINSIMNQYQSLKYLPVILKQLDQFRMMASLEEDGTTVFLEIIDEMTSEEAVSKFLMRMEVNHPTILPLKGFSYEDVSFKRIIIYRETTEKFTPIDYKMMRKASDEQKIKWMKQITDLNSYLIESTDYIINQYFLREYAVLDPNNNIVFVNLDFIDQYDDDTDDLDRNFKSFWDLINDFMKEEKNPLPVNFPVYVSKIFNKLMNERGYEDFCILKVFLDKYDPKTDQKSSEIYKYLGEYGIVKEIEGHHCHVSIYRRNILSKKRFKRLLR